MVPEVKELRSWTVENIIDTLNANVLAGKDYLDRSVKGYIIGAMTPESALKWLRSGAGKALVTGGDRNDLILAALETHIRAVILTGNLRPDLSILTRANEKKIPVILVPQDTYTTIMSLEQIDETFMFSSSLKKQVQLMHRIINDHVDWKKILDDYNDWKKIHSNSN